MKLSWLDMLRLEARLVFRRTEILIALVVFSLLLALAGTEGQHALRRQLATVANVRAVEAHTLNEGAALSARLDAKLEIINRFRDPRDGANFVRLMLQTPIFKQPPVGFSLDASQASLLPTYFQLNTGPSSKIITAYEYDNPQTFVLSRIDFSFVLVYLLPLFLILAIHSIRTDEVQRGMAPLLEMASGRSLAVYARRMLVACLPFFALFLSAEAMTLAFSTTALHSGFNQWLGAFFGAACIASVYTLFWAATLLIGIENSRTPAAALVKLLAVWVAVVVLVPSLATVTVDRLFPAVQRADLIDEARRTNDALAKQTPQLIRAYALKHPGWRDTERSDMPVPAGASALILSEAADRALAPHEQAIERTTLAQLHVLRLFAALSPALAAQMQMDRLGGEDLLRQAAFLAATRDAISRLRCFFAPLLLVSSPGDATRFAQLASYPRSSGLHTPSTRWFDVWDGFCVLITVCCLALLWLRFGAEERISTRRSLFPAQHRSARTSVSENT